MKTHEATPLSDLQDPAAAHQQVNDFSRRRPRLQAARQLPTAGRRLCGALNSGRVRWVRRRAKAPLDAVQRLMPLHSQRDPVRSKARLTGAVVNLQRLRHACRRCIGPAEVDGTTDWWGRRMIRKYWDQTGVEAPPRCTPLTCCTCSRVRGGATDEASSSLLTTRAAAVEGPALGAAGGGGVPRGGTPLDPARCGVAAAAWLLLGCGCWLGRREVIQSSRLPARRSADGRSWPSACRGSAAARRPLSSSARRAPASAAACRSGGISSGQRRRNIMRRPAAG